MGRHTYLSLPEAVRPLPGRVNIVISSSASESFLITTPTTAATPASAVVLCARSFTSALELAWKQDSAKPIFVIGGARVYACALKHPLCATLHVTHLYDGGDASILCDVFLPPICRATYEIVSTEPMVEGRREQHSDRGVNENDAPLEGPKQQRSLPAPAHQFITYGRRHEETQYQDLIRDIFARGVCQANRTGTPAYSVFGTKMVFSLYNNTLPIFVSKSVFWRAIVEELLWFCRGSTDVLELQAKRIPIWDDDFADGQRRGIKSGLGPIYGHQWRFAGAQYVDCKTNYAGQGVDQLVDLLHKLRTNSTDRRMIICSWNVAQLKEMALPPCHLLFQAYVEDGKYLHSQMYQRSADVGLGLPYNVTSYSLLTHILAHLADLVPGTFTWIGGDTHCYQDHMPLLLEQAARPLSSAFPTVRFDFASDAKFEDLKFENFTLVGYAPHKPIKLKLHTGLGIAHNSVAPTTADEAELSQEHEDPANVFGKRNKKSRTT